MDINKYMPRGGRVVCEDNTEVNIGDLLKQIATVQTGTVDVSSWTKIRNLRKSGLAEKVLTVGDIIDDTWTDVAAPKEYPYQWHVADFQPIELQNGDTEASMLVQAHWAHPFGVQFSHQRAFLACPDGLPVGSYYFTIEGAWGNNVKAGDIVCFKTTKVVPAGGRVSGCYGAPDQAKANWRIYTHSADGKTQIETITPTFAKTDGATNLGTQHQNKREGNLNSTQEMAYGWNRWKTSALRQYLNSDAAKGAWWTAQDEWDVAPDQLNDKAGFLSGCSADFLSALQVVKVTTFANTVNDGGGADVTYDRVFIPSMEQMYCAPQIKGEGTYLEYWKQRSGATAPLAQWGTYPNIITYAVENHTSPQSMRVRSAYRGNALYAWCVNSSGSVDDCSASSASRFAPLVVI